MLRFVEAVTYGHAGSTFTRACWSSGTTLLPPTLLADYIEALIEEIGNPTLLVTKGALKSKIETATQAILHDMKLATKHVV